MTRSISFSRPMTGSSLPSRASWVRLRPNWSRTAEPWPWLLAAAAGGDLLALAAGVAGQELDHGLADAVQVGAELLQDLGGDALALADQAEQDVLGADVVVAELQRLAQRQLQDLLRSRGERDVTGGGRLALTDDLLDLLADRLERDVQGLERLGGDAFTLVDQAEQDVLGPDVVVVEHPRLFLGEDHDAPGAIRESLEHVTVLRAEARSSPPPRGSADHVLPPRYIGRRVCVPSARYEPSIPVALTDARNRDPAIRTSVRSPTEASVLLRPERISAGTPTDAHASFGPRRNPPAGRCDGTDAGPNCQPIGRDVPNRTREGGSRVGANLTDARRVEPVRVLVVDDHPAFRKALSSALSMIEDIEVAGEAGGGIAACEEAEQPRTRRHRHGPVDARSLRHRRDEADPRDAARTCPVVILTAHADEGVEREAREAGAQRVPGRRAPDCKDLVVVLQEAAGLTRAAA